MLSIVILNYNTRELLLENIECVRKNTRNLDHEIILVDNGSTDGSVEFVRDKYSDIKVVRNEKNIGCPAGRNKGFLNSSGDFILFIDSDTSLGDNCVSTLLKIITRDEKIGAVGCKLLNKDGTHQPSAKRFPTLFSEFFNIFFGGKLFPNTKFSQIVKVKDGDTIEVDWLSTALIMFRRDAVIRAGGFDERYFYGGEDADICYRIKKNNYKVIYTSECSAVHLGGGTTRKLMHEIFNAPYYGKILFFEKHYGKHTVRLVKFIGLLQTATELFGFLFLWLFPKKRDRANFAILERYNRLKNIIQKRLGL